MERTEKARIAAKVTWVWDSRVESRLAPQRLGAPTWKVLVPHRQVEEGPLGSTFAEKICGCHEEAGGEGRLKLNTNSS